MMFKLAETKFYIIDTLKSYINNFNLCKFHYINNFFFIEYTI